MPGNEVVIKRVPETVPEEVAKNAGADGSRQASQKEIAMAMFQGKHVAEIAQKMSA